MTSRVRVVVWTLSVLLAPLFGVAITSAAGAADPKVVAHRGASYERPENTMPAFRKAIADGADWIELDVQESSNGRLMIFHDRTLERTTNAETKFGAAAGARSVGDFTFDKLRTLDAGTWFGPRYEGTRIPTLGKVLDLVEPTDLKVMVELKAEEGHSAPGRARVIQILDDGGWIASNRVLVTSFNRTYVHQIRDLPNPGADTVRLGPVFTRDEGQPDVTKFGWAHTLCVPYDNATRAYNADAHAEGLKISSWVANTTTEMQKVADSNADTLVTDRPDKAVTFLR